MYISCVAKARLFYLFSQLIATSSYPDGRCRNHVGVAHSSCYKLLVSVKEELSNPNSFKSMFWTWIVTRVLSHKPSLGWLLCRWHWNFESLIECLIDWLVGWLIWLIDWLIDWLIYWLIDWLIGWLSDWSIDWLIDWLADWVIEWLIDWLIDWLSRFHC